MIGDLTIIFYWWFLFFLLGISVLPLTVRLFKNFPDRGYVFSKVVGMLLLSYVVWFLGSLHIIPFYQETVIIIALLIATFNLLVLNINLDKLPLRIFFFEEILFFLILAFWSLVRGYAPDIRGLEKFMDYGFVNSILRGKYFPPLDMWLAKSPDYMGGYTINYYYFGHLTTAVLTKLSGLASSVTYNLMLGTLCAFTLTGAFSIGLSLLTMLYTGITKSKAQLEKIPKVIIFFALLGGIFTAFGGNLHTMYAFTKGYPNEKPQPPWELLGETSINRYWYPNATRFIPFTIHEFPIYSFVVSDLHGHVIDIPYVFLAIALILTSLNRLNKPLIKLSQKELKLKDMLKKITNELPMQPVNFVLLGLTASVMFMTNAWDGLIYLILAGLLFLIINQKRADISSGKKYQSLILTLQASILLLLLFLIFSLPFNTNFKPFVKGIGVVKPQDRSPFYMPAILWGFFYYNVFAFFSLVLLPAIRKLKKENLPRYKNIKYEKPPQFDIYKSDIFVLVVIFLSTLLLVFPEFFFAKDIYPAHYRANTMFKLGYQAFMMLSIISAYIIYRILNIILARKNLEKRFWHGSGLLLYSVFLLPQLFLVLIYPLFATNSYYGGLASYKGLDGVSWISQAFPDDAKVVEWFNQNVTGQPTILEAVGESYTDYSRISAYTGLPAVLGWPVHEWLWRGTYDEAGKRTTEVQNAYEAKTVTALSQFLKNYDVKYAIVGDMERTKYKNINEANFSSVGKIIFESGSTKVYKINS